MAEERHICALRRQGCGGCPLLETPYPEQLRQKQARVEALLGEFGPVSPILGMKHPWHYRNKAINLLSYMLISLGGIYTYVVFFLDPDGWASTMLKNGTEQSYIDTMNASAPSWLLVVIIAGTLAVAAFSGWVGGKMLKKQFEKAGITA